MNVMYYLRKPFRLVKLKYFSFVDWIGWIVSYCTDLAKTILVIALTSVVVFWISTIFYGTFYYYYVPVVSQERPVYFQFRVCNNGVGMCSFPQANISLIPDATTEVFKVGQTYKIVLDLDLPESEVNRRLGMFMVDMKLYNRRGETIHHSSRTASLHFKSDLLQTLETLIFAPFFLGGYMNQKQLLHVELFPSYRDLSYNPAVGAVIELQNFKVEVYTADLKIFAQFSGLRYFLYYWPITSAVMGISWNFIVIAFIIILSWYHFVWPTQQGNGTSRVEVVISNVKKKYKQRQQVQGQRKGSDGHSKDSPGCDETLGAMGASEETAAMRKSRSPSDSRGRVKSSSLTRDTGCGRSSSLTRDTGRARSSSPSPKDSGCSRSSPSRSSRESGLRLRHTAASRRRRELESKLQGDDGQHVTDDENDDNDEDNSYSSDNSEGTSCVPF